MLELERELAKRLKKLRVEIDVPDGNTVCFRNVPANERFFNKPRTNLLVARPRPGLPFLVGVDEDLEYTGTDEVLARAFAGGQRKQGWRVLTLDPATQADFQAAVDNALASLGFEGREPVKTKPAAQSQPASAANGGLLASFAKNLSQQEAGPHIGCDEAVEEIATCVVQWQLRLPVIAAVSGAGKTQLLHAVAAKLAPRLEALRVDLGQVMAGAWFPFERENLLATLLKETAARPNTVLAMEHVELGLAEPNMTAQVAQALDSGVRLIGTTLAENLRRRVRGTPMARRIHLVQLTERSVEETIAVLRALRERIAGHHKVQIEEALVQATVERAASIEGVFPAKAITLLDAAAARAALAGAAELSLYDIYLVATRFREEK